MRGFEVLEELPRWPDFSLFRILQALADTLLGVGTGGNVEQSLIGLGVLHDSRGLALHRKHHGALGLLELFHEVAGSAAECRQRLYIVRNIKHGTAPGKAPF